MPFAPVLLPEILLPLTVFLVIVFYLGTRLISHGLVGSIVHGFATVLHAIPRVGPAIARGADWLGHYVKARLAERALQVARPLAFWFWGLRQVVAFSAFTLTYVAHSTLDAFETLRGVVLPALLRAAVAPIRFAVHAALALAHSAVRAAAATEAFAGREARAMEHRLAHAYAAAVAALRHSVAIPLERGFAGLRGEVHDVVGYTRRTLARRLSRLEKLLGVGALAGFVVAVIARRLPWLRCQNVNNLARHACRLPVKALEDLLAGIVDVLLIADICRIVTLMTRAARLAAPEIELLSSGVAELIRCQNAERPHALAVAWHDPPTVASSLALG